MSKPWILVTGATGTVGSAVARQLIADGQRVRVLLRDHLKSSMYGAGVGVAVADLLIPATLPEVFRGVEKVFVVAPPSPDLEVIEANVFDAAAQAGVRHIVNLSNFGAGAFGPPVWEWHGRSEARLKAGGIPWTILRPARFMTDTPFPWGWQSIKEQSSIFESIGEAKFTAIAIADIAAVAAKVLTSKGHEGKTYELNSEEALTGRQMAAVLSAALGQSVTFAHVPPQTAGAQMTKIGIPGFVVGAVLRFYETVREGRWYTTTTVRDLLGRPATSYEAWLSVAADSFKARLRAN